MHEAVIRMLARYEPKSVDDSVRALREIIQEVALLGLWRAKFFEQRLIYRLEVETALALRIHLSAAHIASPGSTPTTAPRRIPATAMRKFWGVRNISKPASKDCMASMASAPPAQRPS